MTALGDKAGVVDHRSWSAVFSNKGWFVMDGLLHVASIFGRLRHDETRKVALVTAAAPELLEALLELVRINEEHNEAMAKIIGRPVGWKDSYLDAARAAIAKAQGGAA